MGECYIRRRGGQSAGNLEVGSVVKLVENGAEVEYLVVHQGNPDTSLYDSSCDGTWVLRKDCLYFMTWDDNGYNRYSTSDAQMWLDAVFMPLFDASVRAKIKQVKIPYRDGIGSELTPIKSGSDGWPCQAFLLSAAELGAENSSMHKIPQDGAGLDYFINSADAKAARVANYVGSPAPWWTRSPACGRDIIGVYFVAAKGQVSSAGPADSFTYCSRPALILPENFTEFKT